MGIQANNVEVGFELPSINKTVTSDKIVAYANIFGPPISNSIHDDEKIAKAAGLPQTIAVGAMLAQYLSQMLLEAFGEKWINGGKLSVSFIRPVFPGDILKGRGIIREKVPETSFCRLSLGVWCENQKNEKVAVGTASVLV